MAIPPQPHYVAYGPDANCTLSVCDVSQSVYGYQPSLAANITFLVLFCLSLVICVAEGVRWRTWSFTIAMFFGYVCEIVGYGGRILLWQDPFSFTGFMIQIVCITVGPAFFSAAIYLTLANVVQHLGVQHSRFTPKLYYWIFIPCDLVSLTLQGTGGGLSSSSSGSSQTAIDIALAGLSFQVVTLTVFIVLALDYAYRFKRDNSRASTTERKHLSTSFKVFVAFLSLAIVCILIRCAYRIDELSQGYSGPLISNEGLFIGLEGAMIAVAAFSLNAVYPGIGEVYNTRKICDREFSVTSDVQTEKSKLDLGG